MSYPVCWYADISKLTHFFPCQLQLLLTFDPILVEKVANMLYLVMQDNPNLQRLYLTGVFFFIMMYTGSNVLPVARWKYATNIISISKQIWIVLMTDNRQTTDWLETDWLLMVTWLALRKGL